MCDRSFDCVNMEVSQKLRLCSHIFFRMLNRGENRKSGRFIWITADGLKLSVGSMGSSILPGGKHGESQLVLRKRWCSFVKQEVSTVRPSAGFDRRKPFPFPFPVPVPDPDPDGCEDSNIVCHNAQEDVEDLCTGCFAAVDFDLFCLAQ